MNEGMIVRSLNNQPQAFINDTTRVDPETALGGIFRRLRRIEADLQESRAGLHDTMNRAFGAPPPSVGPASSEGASGGMIGDVFAALDDLDALSIALREDIYRANTIA